MGCVDSSRTFCPIITLGRWRQDFDNQSRVKEIVIELVFKLGFTARDYDIHVGVVRSLWDGDSHVAGMGPTPTTPQLSVNIRKGIAAHDIVPPAGPRESKDFTLIVFTLEFGFALNSQILLRRK